MRTPAPSPYVATRSCGLRIRPMSPKAPETLAVPATRRGEAGVAPEAQLPGNRWAPGLLAAALAVGGFLLLAVFGEGQWFSRDDWQLIGYYEVLQDHNQHWSTVTIVAYRALYLVFGLNSYVPYQIVGVLVHLLVVCLLFLIMRRARVQPWVAAIAAGSFILYAPGAPLLLSQFQMTLGLSLGLIQLLLADHDGANRTRDALALGAGLLAIMTSGVGVAVVAGVGVAVLLKRGWLAATIQTLPLAVIYLLWWTQAAPGGRTARFDLAAIVEWCLASLEGVALGLGGSYLLIGGLLALFTVVGALLTLRRYSLATLRVRCNAVAGLSITGLLLVATTYFGRGFFGSTEASSGRFSYLLVACFLPLIAVSFNELIGRWVWTAVPTLGLLLLVVPIHFAALVDGTPGRQANSATLRQQLAAIHPFLADSQVPDEVRPWIGRRGTGMGELEMGFLRSASRTDRLEAPTNPAGEQTREQATTRIGLAQQRAIFGVDPADCQEITTPEIRKTNVGDIFRFSTNPYLRLAPMDLRIETADTGITVRSELGEYLEVVLPLGRVEFSSATPGRSTYLCRTSD